MKKNKLLKVIGSIVLAAVIITAGVLGYYTITEYRPDKIETLKVPKDNSRTVSVNDDFSIMTYNTGYGALSKTEDCYFDGGKTIQPESKKLIEDNLTGISSILKQNPADAYFLQEVDINSKRSYKIDQKNYYEEKVGIPEHLLTLTSAIMFLIHGLRLDT